MSINFNDTANEEAQALMREFYGQAVASDGRQFLHDQLVDFRQQDMKAIADAAGQSVEVQLHSPDDVKTLADGSQYRVTQNGWKKID